MDETNKESPITNRLLWGDIAKGIAIILVIIGHSYPPNGQVSRFVFLFHIPVFFFLAGYFFNFQKYEFEFKKLLINTYHRLFIPAIFTFLLFYTINYAVFLKTLLYAICKPIPEWGIYPIGASWFLFCLIILRILFWCFLKLTKKLKFNLITNIMSSLLIALLGVKIGQIIKLPWSIDIAMVAVYIAYIGYIFKEYLIFEKKNVMFFIIPVAIVLGYIDFCYFGLSMNDRFYSNNPLISINTSILLSCVIIYISVLVSKLNILKINKIIQYIGYNSLIILLFHTYIYSPINYGFCTILRLLICILIIEIFAIIPELKNIYGAKSIKDFLKQPF